MALTMEAGSLRELSAPNSVRQESTSGPPPFSHSRLRGYASRVEGMLDPKIVLSSSVALTAAGMADPFPPVGGSGGAASLMSPRGGLLPGGSESYSATPPQQPHHARFSPSLFAPPAASGGSPGSGGFLHTARFSPEQMQRPTGGSTPPTGGPMTAWPPSPGGVAAAGAAGASPEELSTALSQIQALKAEIAGVETVLGYLKGSETSTTTLGRKAHKLPSQEQLRARADALATSRAATRLGGGAAAAASATGGGDSLLLAPLRTSIGHGFGSHGVSACGSPARAKSAGDAQAAAAAAGGGGGGGNGTAVFDTLAAETKLGRTWRAPRGPQPVGRGEAVILEAALDEALPAGAITAKYGSGAAVELSFWSGGDVRQDFEMLDMVQREVSRQVSVSCVERGRIIDKLADRHSEIFVAVSAAAKAAAEAQRSLTDELAAVRTRAVEQASEIASLRSDLASRGAESEDLREQLAESTTAHEHHVWDTEQEVEQLQGQADILAAEVEHLHVRLSEAVAEKDAALSRGLERLEGDLEAVTDERDDLAQRIRFLERQLHKLRTEMNAAVDTVSVEVQTDPINWGPVEEEDVPDDCSDTPSLAQIRARYETHGYGALTPEERIRLGLPPHMGSETSKEHKGRKRRRALGHFEGLISSEKPGRVRGLPWTMNAISALYYDKHHADAVSDREGNPRLRLSEFAVEWHMTRFGLRNLAEMHLLDLIASVRQHYRKAVRVRWFGQFTGLVEVGDTVDTTPHVSFYLTLLTHLAAPNSLVSLFPDSGGEEGGGTPPVALKAAALPEATRAVFRYLGEPEGAGGFLARAVDPLTDPASQLVPLDPLVALFMAEYQKRWERNAAHLRALFRAGDYDDDGLIGYDEFVALVRQLIPDCAERMATRMYGDAVRRLPEGQSLVDVDTFMAVARAFGWDRWRIDIGATTTTTNISGGGSVLKSLPSHWSLSGPIASSQSTSLGGAPTATAAAAAAAEGSGPGAVSRSESAMARSALAAASSNSLKVTASGGSSQPPQQPPSSQSYNRSVSNLRREESVVGLSDADRALLRVLDGALEGLDPPLEHQVTGLLDKLRATVAAAQQQAAAAAAAVASMPGLDLGPSARELAAAIAADSVLVSKLDGQFTHFRTVYGERTDPAAAWLAFRLLLASLAAATAGPRARNTSRSRPGSAKGTVGWGVSRSVMRLTVPPLPFRAGSAARALTSGGGAATTTITSNTSRSSPAGGGLGLGLGLTSAPNSASLQLLLSGAASSRVLGGFGGGGGEGSLGSGVGMAAAATAATGGGMMVGGMMGGGMMGSATSRSPSPLQRCSSRSPTKSPELSVRPTGLAQIIQGGSTAGGSGGGGGGSGSFADRLSPPSLVIPSPTAPAPLNRAPMPATVPGRGSALTSAPTGSASTPTRRGVAFSLGTPPPPPPGPAAAAGSITPDLAPTPLAAASAAETASESETEVPPPPPPPEQEGGQEGGQETMRTETEVPAWEVQGDPDADARAAGAAAAEMDVGMGGGAEGGLGAEDVPAPEQAAAE